MKKEKTNEHIPNRRTTHNVPDFLAKGNGIIMNDKGGSAETNEDGSREEHGLEDEDINIDDDLDDL
jgi:hypothetical protein